MARQVPVVTRRVVAISPDDGTVIDLGRPAIAALLSWLVPGLGQILQGRTLKGGLFMGSLMATLVIGLWLGAGRVVRGPRCAGPGPGIPARGFRVQAIDARQ